MKVMEKSILSSGREGIKKKKIFIHKRWNIFSRSLMYPLSLLTPTTDILNIEAISQSFFNQLPVFFYLLL